MKPTDKPLSKCCGAKVIYVCWKCAHHCDLQEPTDLESRLEQCGVPEHHYCGNCNCVRFTPRKVEEAIQDEEPDKTACANTDPAFFKSWGQDQL